MSHGADTTAPPRPGPTGRAARPSGGGGAGRAGAPPGPAPRLAGAGTPAGGRPDSPVAAAALLRELAGRVRRGVVAERAAVAAGPGTPPELLTFLAADPAPEVRVAVAGNSATPARAGLLLAEDADTAVRSALARRIGALAPGLGAPARDRLARITSAILTRLVADAAVEVRAALADAVAGLPDAPRELILRLARDAELPVCGPVIRLSPLLTEADLLGLAAAPPAAATRRCVAARPGLPEPVCDAIADSHDPPAIAALLANDSAAIREATLDRLAASAGGRPGWQAALVRRPRLPPEAARALGMLMAGRLLAALAARPDLPQGLAAELHRRVADRLAAAAPLETAAREAARAGDRATLVLRLAEAAQLSPGRAEAACATRSPRLIAALCWKAGWSPPTGETVQLALGVPRPQLVRANAEGGWTLTEAELLWQIELLEDLPA